jgi:hypothetical protein
VLSEYQDYYLTSTQTLPWCLSTHLAKHHSSQLLSSHVQKLPVLRRTPPPPRLTPNPYRHRRSHAQHDHDSVESKDRPKASGIDEILQRLRDGEVDTRRADGEDNDDFPGYLLEVVSSAIV